MSEDCQNWPELRPEIMNSFLGAKALIAIDPDDMFRIAVHEAGHVVIGYDLGFDVRGCVLLNGTLGYLGETFFDHSLIDANTPFLTQKWLQTIMAGSVAESLLGVNNDQTIRGMRADESQAETVIIEAWPNKTSIEIQAMKAVAWNATVDYAQHRINRIRVVADYIIAHSFIRMATVQRLIGPPQP